MKFRELRAGQLFVFAGRIHDGEIRRKVSRHKYVWVDGVKSTSRSFVIGDEESSPWPARGETEVSVVDDTGRIV